MKLATIGCFFLTIGIIATACCAPKNVTPETGRAAPVEVALLREGVSVVGVKTPRKPLSAHVYLLVNDGKKEHRIRTSQELPPFLNAISSPELALAYVRFISSQEIRPYLTDMYYTEVQRQAEGKPAANAEPSWFTLTAAQYKTWQVHEPVVTTDGARYKIERFVASYPRVKDETRLPAQLLKIWEWVEPTGKYTMEIQQVITEGQAIHSILMFTK